MHSDRHLDAGHAVLIQSNVILGIEPAILKMPFKVQSVKLKGISLALKLVLEMETNWLHCKFLVGHELHTLSII